MTTPQLTNTQYRIFIAAGGYKQQQWWSIEGWEWRTANNIVTPRFWDNADWNKPSYPVVGISWYEAIAYSNWLATTTNLGIRLPNEAEWEKAARGTDGFIFPWGNEWAGSHVNYCDSNCVSSWKDEVFNDRYQYTAPVGSYLDGESPYVALDMVGNVWEWTSSQYTDYNSTVMTDDTMDVLHRMVRGGSWYDDPNTVRTATRKRYRPSDRDDVVGIRLVMTRE